MGYSLPVKFVKVSNDRSDNRQFDTAICITRIVALMSMKINQARETVRDERKAGTLINAAGVCKVQTAIFLDNGSVVASPLSVNRILSAIEKVNSPTTPNLTKNINVYDVDPSEGESEEDEEYDEEYEEEDE